MSSSLEKISYIPQILYPGKMVLEDLGEKSQTNNNGLNQQQTALEEMLKYIL